MLLSAAGLRAEVDDEITDLARARCTLDRFAIRGRSAHLRLRRVRAPGAQARTIGSGQARDGTFTESADTLSVCLPDDPLVAEAALRMVYRRAAMAQRGLLLHAAAFVVAGRALVATGASGAGKSTLASLCQEAIGSQVLSDEIIAITPDGRAYGTPFWSQGPMEGALTESRLGAIVGLRKGEVESVVPTRPFDAVALLDSQCFRATPAELGQAELLKRLAYFSEHPGVHWLTFRKDPAVAHFVKRWMSGEANDQLSRHILA
jgi:hypothetical protein